MTRMQEIRRDIASTKTELDSVRDEISDLRGQLGIAEDREEELEAALKGLELDLEYEREANRVGV